jgi:hypothetical protein
VNGERQAPDPGPAVAARFGAKGAELEGGPARGAVAVLVHPVAQHAGGLGTQQEFDQPAAQFVALTGAAEQAGEDAPVVVQEQNGDAGLGAGQQGVLLPVHALIGVDTADAAQRIEPFGPIGLADTQGRAVQTDPGLTRGGEIERARGVALRIDPRGQFRAVGVHRRCYSVAVAVAVAWGRPRSPSRTASLVHQRRSRRRRGRAKIS